MNIRISFVSISMMIAGCNGAHIVPSPTGQCGVFSPNNNCGVCVFKYCCDEYATCNADPNCASCTNDINGLGCSENQDLTSLTSCLDSYCKAVCSDTTNNSSSSSSSSGSGSGSSSSSNSSSSGSSSGLGLGGSGSSGSGSGSSSGVVIFDAGIDVSSVHLIPQFSNQPLIPYSTLAQYGTCGSYCTSISKTCSEACVDPNVQNVRGTGFGVPASLEYVCELPDGTNHVFSLYSTEDLNHSTQQPLNGTTSCMTNVVNDANLIDGDGGNIDLYSLYCYSLLPDGGYYEYGRVVNGVYQSNLPNNIIGTVYDNYVKCCCL